MEITNSLLNLHNVPLHPHPGEQSCGGLRLYILLFINMWSVCSQWWRGFTCTIKTDATFYLLNGREAEHVALDHVAACCWRITTFPLARRLLRWMALREKACSFLGRCGGGMKEFFSEDELMEGPNNTYFSPAAFIIIKKLKRTRRGESGWGYSC